MRPFKNVQFCSRYRKALNTLNMDGLIKVPQLDHESACDKAQGADSISKMDEMEFLLEYFMIILYMYI